MTIGVDFGTSTTLIAEGGPRAAPSIVPMGETTPWMPTLAAERNGELVVGEDALRRGPGAVIHSVKRLITERRETVATADGSRTFSVDAVIGAILRELGGRARYEGLDVGEAGTVRLGCPAMWDAAQRTRLLGLASDAGFAVGPATLVDEPVAAALNWVNAETLRGRYLENERVLVFDMGGGTLDVAVLDVTAGPGQDPEIFVLASDGIDEAGDRLDVEIALDLAAALEDLGISLDDVPEPALARAYLRRAATAAKLALSDDRSTSVDIGYTGAELPILTYAREELENALQPQMKRALELVVGTLRGALLTSGKISNTVELRGIDLASLGSGVTHVLLAGGMSQVPGVARSLEREFPHSSIHYADHSGVQGAIAAGLAETTSYDRVNLQRPAFDFVIEWDAPDGTIGEVLVYRAHTPLYSPWEAQTLTSLRYSWSDRSREVDAGSGRPLPRTGAGALRVKALDGSYVPLRHRGVESQGLRVEFGSGESRFVIAPEGQIQFTDGKGNVRRVRVERWPVLRGGRERAALSLMEASWTPMDRRSWDSG